MKKPTKKELAAWKRFRAQISSITTDPGHWATNYYWLYGYRQGQRDASKPRPSGKEGR